MLDTIWYTNKIFLQSVVNEATYKVQYTALKVNEMQLRLVLVVAKI